MALASWQWDEAELEDGDDIGFCMYQASGSSSENYAQCWAYNWLGGEYDLGRSLQLKPSVLTANVTLEDFEPLDFASPVGTEGTWIMSKPVVAFDTTKIAFTAKFSPADASR